MQTAEKRRAIRKLSGVSLELGKGPKAIVGFMKKAKMEILNFGTEGNPRYFIRDEDVQIMKAIIKEKGKLAYEET